MSSKKTAIQNSLENLSAENLGKFRSALVDRGGEQEVTRAKVENKDVTEITDVVVSTFTEDGAPAVVIELLNDIKCCDEAKKLDDKIAKLKSSAAKSGCSFSTSSNCSSLSWSCRWHCTLQR
ncbi:pyrin domain-containing protein 1-like [Vanacampus margaritifer]